MERKDAVAKSFDFAADLIKQLLTLAIGIITVTGTAARFIFDEAAPESKDWMFYAWIVLSFSVVFGVMSLMTLTGNLVSPNVPEGTSASSSTSEPTIYNPATKLFVSLQFLTFLAGILLFIAFATAGYTCVSADQSRICSVLL